MVSAKKRRKPIYSVKEWRRSLHIRRYKDASKKVFKASAETLDKAVNNKRRSLANIFC